jgi:hypothetical protein
MTTTCFDRVLSALGVIFAPRHAVTARELVRVCKPGGVIGLVNWNPGGQVVDAEYLVVVASKDR